MTSVSEASSLFCCATTGVAAAVQRSIEILVANTDFLKHLCAFMDITLFVVCTIYDVACTCSYFVALELRYALVHAS
jgi:hypothetical protein